MTLHPQIIRDGIGVIGTLLLGYGAWLHYPPLGFMLCGLAMVVLTVVGTIRSGGGNRR